MRLDWIDDILAVLDSGSLANAAERRLLSQSAFTRRIRSIEESIGVTLFDRRRKPVTLTPGVQALAPELRELSARLHKLQQMMQATDTQTGQSLAFVCQHALTTTVSPRVVKSLTQGCKTTVQVRSGNQDDCLMQLISKKVDFAIMYALPDETTLDPGSAFDSVELGADMMVPVCTPQARSKLANRPVPVISYPPDVFLGQVFSWKIRPRLPNEISVTTIAETALTLAMLQFVLSGIGMAWLPRSLIADHLAQGRLVTMDDLLPAQPLTIKMRRLAEGQSDHAEQAWQYLVEHPPT